MGFWGARLLRGPREPAAERPLHLPPPDAPPRRAARGPSLPRLGTYREPAPAQAPAARLECSDPAALAAFKQRVRALAEEAAGEGGGPLAAGWTAACLCGPPGAAEDPRAFLAAWPGLPLPACPARPSGPPSPDDLRRLEEGTIEVARFFHGLLPVDQAQAIRMAECFCGPMSRGTRGEVEHE